MKKKEIIKERKIDERTGLDSDFVEAIVNEVRLDFEKRAMERRPLEAQWQLNASFLEGNQNMAISFSGSVEENRADYFWQERQVYNHIAPIYETRLAKLGRLRPQMAVIPSSGDEDDIRTAKTASKILASVASSLEVDSLIRKATMWSELCGSAFYKVFWDANAGKRLGTVSEKEIFEGEVKISVCPAYEIYPSSLAADGVDEVESIMHAKAVPVAQVNRMYSVEVAPEPIETFSATSIRSGGFVRESVENHVLVIERYTRPNEQHPNGEFTVVAGTKLLYTGELPFFNGSFSLRDLPFIRQDSLRRPGHFFGQSIIERVIPIQRAYNTVKNRKHEFLNRIAMGVLAVEDGSVDIDNLEEEGLSPGKILSYRQGSPPPRLLDSGRVPFDFTQEEERLLSEIISISGVSEVMRNSASLTNMSGVAIQLLIEQDDTRLAITADIIRGAIRMIGKHILRLYKQFAGPGRLNRVVGDGGEVELIYWSKSDITCDDVVLETQNEISQTPAMRQTMMFDLLRTGLLSDENGRLSDSTRHKILQNLGYGGWENLQDLESLNIQRAIKENLRLYKDKVEVTEIESHKTHIVEHTKFMLTPEFERLSKSKAALRERFLEHIRQHKKFDALLTEAMIQQAAEAL